MTFKATLYGVCRLVMAVVLAVAAAANEGAAIERMATCRNAICVMDAYFTLHSPSRGAKFFYHARMLQLYPGNRKSEIALLETLPRSEKEAASLQAVAAVAIRSKRGRETRDAIASELPYIYWRAVRRHRELMSRLITARQWMDSRFNEVIDRQCNEAGIRCGRD